MNESAIIITSDPGELNALDIIWSYVEGVLDSAGQLTILALLFGVLLWTIVQTRRDTYLWKQLCSWVQSSTGALILICILVYISPLVMPETDQFGVYRILVLRSTSFLGGMFLITGAILFVSRTLFPEGLFKEVLKTDYGATAVLCSIILGLVYLMTFS